MTNKQWGLDPVRDADMLIYAAHVYYHEPDIQSPLTDEEFDALVTLVGMNWDDLFESQQEKLISPEEMQTTTFYIKLESWEIEDYKEAFNDE